MFIYFTVKLYSAIEMMKTHHVKEKNMCRAPTDTSGPRFSLWKPWKTSSKTGRKILIQCRTYPPRRVERWSGNLVAAVKRNDLDVHSSSKVVTTCYNTICTSLYIADIAGYDFLLFDINVFIFVYKYYIHIYIYIHIHMWYVTHCYTPQNLPFSWFNDIYDGLCLVCFAANINPIVTIVWSNFKVVTTCLWWDVRW